MRSDFHIGLNEKHYDRVAVLDTSLVKNLETSEIEEETSIIRRLRAHGHMGAEIANTDRWRKAEFPAANGHGNARSVAQIHNLIACHGKSGTFKLLSPETIERIFEIQTDGQDLVLGVPIRHGLGFGLTSDTLPVSPNKKACYWGGWGGSLAVIDVDSKMSFAYVMNKMAPSLQHDLRAGSILMAAHSAMADFRK